MAPYQGLLTLPERDPLFEFYGHHPTIKNVARAIETRGKGERQKGTKRASQDFFSSAESQNTPQPPPTHGRIPKGVSVVDRMRGKMLTQQGKRHHVLKMKTMELVLGQIKLGRGCRQFMLRGLAKVKGEWKLICTGYNIMKLFGGKKQGLVGQGTWARA